LRAFLYSRSPPYLSSLLHRQIQLRFTSRVVLIVLGDATSLSSLLSRSFQT
jgi:hypothetical protein